MADGVTVGETVTAEFRAALPGGRDAILYIPGIGESGLSDPLESAARRIADALDRQSVDSFTVSAVQEQKLTETRCTRVVTISRGARGKQVPVADVFEIDYSEALGGGFRQMKPIWQALVILGVLISCLPRLLAAWGRKSQRASHKLQVLYAGAAFIVLAAYLPVVIGAALGMAAKVVPGIADYQLVLPRGITIGWKEFTSSMQDLVVAMTAVGLFTTFNLKQGLAKFAAEYTPIIRYIAMGDRQGAVSGAVVSVLNHILDQESSGGQRYGRIHVVGYSFGTVVALDTLFPRMQPSPLFARINTLVTIACPFDFVRTYWSNYFADRNAPGGHIDWWNVYDPLDVLSSDFFDTAEKGGTPVQVGIGPGDRVKPTNLPPQGSKAAGWLDWVLLVGFRRHSQYWDRLGGGDVNCFDVIVPNLYPPEPIVAAAGQ